ncbi:MAG: aldo/keto reductase [Microthrixaceae bacterium]
MSTVPTITLNDGVQIPKLGFGTFQIDPNDTVEATKRALDVGYRHIDTAQMYGNEAQVGEAIRQSKLDPADVFVTSKLNNNKHARADALAGFDATLDALGLDTLDLFLIHWPLPDVGDFVETWQALEEIKATGRCRSIGVSNFQAHHLQRLFEETDTVPSVNQVEVHPYFAQHELRAFNADHGIVTEAWAPIAQGRILDDETLRTIGETHHKSAAQVALRWHIQRGDIIFPKTTTPERLTENFEIFDFELSDDEMSRVTGLDRGQRNGPNPDEFNMVP